ncbi:HDOD domain-containing protein [Pseudodesulfovibrio sp. F-1]|uniref:HDOD domain-containing protein n=1 Tax=Pseudodesulfovibrio alkaliphilus TaxID=2661613 RepID=A0A7K1KQN1_9BACT|nr:HDOD domain-containing protein [Pseudodesulfovibrio alkaliphilus]MUM78399.1 HDOD domain-containing protein [Pseudodesulfovibrio alkaliphilus]
MADAVVQCQSLPEEPLLVVRQPIFDRDKSVWGYELRAGSTRPDGSPATLADILDAYRATLGPEGGTALVRDKKILLSIAAENGFDGSLADIDCCVFGLCGRAASSSRCRDLVEALHERGGIVALDVDADGTADPELVRKADIVKVSLSGKTPPEIVRLRARFKSFGGELLATDVSGWEAFEGTRALGFRYFQGPFFGVPLSGGEAALAATATAKLQLLRELANPECEMDELAGIIASDITLSYRMLKYINSASFGLRNKIKSIQQAVSLLGLNEIRHWATVVVVTDLDSTPKGEELAYMALQRGRFLSKLAGTIKGFPHSASTMFMLGLFSLLDALLSYPMDKALEGVPLDDEIKAALCGTLNEFRDWLLMVEAVELGNWTVANEILSRYGACFTQAATQYMKASAWAASQIPNMRK